MRFLVLCVASAILAGCGGDTSTLFVELQTDFTPSAEFSSVHTAVFSGAEMVAERSRQARVTDSGAAGIRVAEFDGVGNGSHRIAVRLLDSAGTELAEASITRDLGGQTGVTVMITRSCSNVVCPPGDEMMERCLAGECVPDRCDSPSETGCGTSPCDTADDCSGLSQCSRAICTRGACFVVAESGFCAQGETCDVNAGCIGSASVDGGVPDAPSTCDADRPCDDGIACTDDRCVGGNCEYAANNGACSAAPDGFCDPATGCQYSTCTPETCMSTNACMTAECEGSTCVMSPACGEGQQCCGGECVPAGCDDENGCTDDACAETGCEHTNNTARCDDGVFCNGAEACTGGMCADAADACRAPAMCDEDARSCVGCLTSDHCPDPSTAWGACGGFDDACDTTGTQSGPETTYSCNSGACIPNTRTAMQGCSRSTSGIMCSVTVVGPLGTCLPARGDICNRAGTQRRTTTTYACSSEVCVPSSTTATSSCTRPPTAGDDCSDTVTCEPGMCTSGGACLSQPPCAWGYPGCDHLGSCLR